MPRFLHGQPPPPSSLDCPCAWRVLRRSRPAVLLPSSGAAGAADAPRAVLRNHCCRPAAHLAGALFSLPMLCSGASLLCRPVFRSWISSPPRWIGLPIYWAARVTRPSGLLGAAWAASPASWAGGRASPGPRACSHYWPASSRDWTARASARLVCLGLSVGLVGGPCRICWADRPALGRRRWPAPGPAVCRFRWAARASARRGLNRVVGTATAPGPRGARIPALGRWAE